MFFPLENALFENGLMRETTKTITENVNPSAVDETEQREHAELLGALYRDGLKGFLDTLDALQARLEMEIAAGNP